MPAGEPIFITKNGYGDLVVMSIETYEAMVEKCSDRRRDFRRRSRVCTGRAAPRRKGSPGFSEEKAF